MSVYVCMCVCVFVYTVRVLMIFCGRYQTASMSIFIV